MSGIRSQRPPALCFKHSTSRMTEAYTLACVLIPSSLVVTAGSQSSWLVVTTSVPRRGWIMIGMWWMTGSLTPTQWTTLRRRGHLRHTGRLAPWAVCTHTHTHTHTLTHTLHTHTHTHARTHTHKHTAHAYKHTYTHMRTHTHTHTHVCVQTHLHTHTLGSWASIWCATSQSGAKFSPWHVTYSQ